MGNTAVTIGGMEDRRGLRRQIIQLVGTKNSNYRGIPLLESTSPEIWTCLYLPERSEESQVHVFKVI
jgi:hypothetical protein